MAHKDTMAQRKESIAQQKVTEAQQLEHLKTMGNLLLHKPFLGMPFLGKTHRSYRETTLPDLKWMHFEQKLEKEILLKKAQSITEDIQRGLIVSKKEILELMLYSKKISEIEADKEQPPKIKISLEGIENINTIGPPPPPPCPTGMWPRFYTVIYPKYEIIKEIKAESKNGSMSDKKDNLAPKGPYDVFKLDSPVGPFKDPIELIKLTVTTTKEEYEIDLWMRK